MTNWGGRPLWNTAPQGPPPFLRASSSAYSFVTSHSRSQHSHRVKLISIDEPLQRFSALENQPMCGPLNSISVGSLAVRANRHSSITCNPPAKRSSSEQYAQYFGPKDLARSYKRISKLNLPLRLVCCIIHHPLNPSILPEELSSNCICRFLQSSINTHFADIKNTLPAWTLVWNSKNKKIKIRYKWQQDFQT